MSATAPSAATDRRAARRERTRAQIVDAAWGLARRDGIAQLSLRDLAAEVGMRAPSLYGYFDSKDGIYDAMFAEGYRALDGALEASLADAGSEDAETRFVLATTAFLTFCAADLARYQLMFTRIIPAWEPSPEAYAASIASYERMTAWLADVGVDQPRDVDLWTSIVAGLAAQQAANEPGGDRYVTLAADAASMFLSHLEATR